MKKLISAVCFLALASPALAASIVAFSARRFVCEDMAEMASVTFPISCAAEPSSLTCTVAFPVATTACPVICLALPVYTNRSK